MNFASTIRAALLLLAVVAGGARIASGSDDDMLVRAKGLYSAAAYDEALAVLDQLQKASPEESMAIAEYRVFCLLALDRRDEARANIDRILHDNPLYQPSADQTSPRIQTIFHEVRRQSLPKIVMERYTAAKAAFERKDSGAAQQFEDVVTLLADPDLGAMPALADLRTIASAFRDLAKAQAASEANAAVTKAEPQPPVPAEQIRDVIYTSADADVTPPLPRSQKMPLWRPAPQSTVQEFRGVLRIVIDQSGAVVSAAMAATTVPAYDSLLIRAARDWKFLPAQKQGVPVRYLKLIEIQLKATVP